MNIKQFNFPKLSEADIAFSVLTTNKELLNEATKRGFYNDHTPYNKLFSTLFFSGGALNFKKDIDNEFKSKATPYLKAFMISMEPQHEEKEAVCAMLLSELVNV